MNGITCEHLKRNYDPGKWFVLSDSYLQNCAGHLNNAIAEVYSL